MIRMTYYIWHNRYFNINMYILIIILINYIFKILFTIIILVIIVFLLGALFRKKINFYAEKMSPFECGFSPIFNARLPFSIRFFLISLVFLVFDVELIILFPFIVNINFRNIFIINFAVIFFILILILGLYHEWNQGRLDWVN